jgi:serine/threonine protein kinase
MNPDDLPSVGDTLVGKYRLTRKLGQGGMGAVFKATHLRLGQKVAIKIMLPQVAQRPELAYRFEYEARAAARLRGKHAVRVSDVDMTPEGLPFLVMEFLEGHSLLDELKQRGPLPIGEAVHYVREACEGVEEAHRAGIIHRDLKPANIFLSIEGDQHIVKVVDFGIAKVSDASDTGYHTATGAHLGTYRYMSPEQAESARSVDARTDVWSLGVVLYQLLSDKTPFHGEGAIGIMYAIATQGIPPLRDARADVPEPLVAVVERALSKKRENRYQTARDLADALAPFDNTPNAPSPRSPATLLAPETLPPSPERAASRASPPYLPSDEVPNESVTSGSNSHVLPIRRAAPSQGFLVVPRWFVGSCVVLLFGASVVIGIGAMRLRSSEATLTTSILSQRAPLQGLSVPTPPPSPSTAPERSAPPPPPLPLDTPISRSLEASSEADGSSVNKSDRMALAVTGAPTANTSATASSRSNKSRQSKPAGETPASAAVSAPPQAPAPKVLSAGEIFD